MRSGLQNLAAKELDERSRSGREYQVTQFGSARRWLFVHWYRSYSCGWMWILCRSLRNMRRYLIYTTSSTFYQRKYDISMLGIFFDTATDGTKEASRANTRALQEYDRKRLKCLILKILFYDSSTLPLPFHLTYPSPISLSKPPHTFPSLHLPLNHPQPKPSPFQHPQYVPTPIPPLPLPTHTIPPPPPPPHHRYIHSPPLPLSLQI